jgi:acetyl-CoA C-acetyltransferase
LEDAELTLKDIDAVLVTNMDFFEGDYLSNQMWADYAGAYLKPGYKINTGGNSGGTTATTAWYHIASGLFDTVLVVAYQKLDEPHSVTTCLTTTFDPIYDRPLGTGAIGALASLAQRYMETTGATEEHAALCRVKDDRNALRNPYAHLKLNITVEDVMKSPTLVTPLRQLHMCPQSCGACAMILASETKASKITSKPVWFRDHITVHQEFFVPLTVVGPNPSPPTETIAAQRFFPRNGITNPRRDLQVFELTYPCIWLQMDFAEKFLICEEGEFHKLLEKGVWDIEGEFPIAPSGGVVATNPIGATVMLRVAEAALQVRGDAGEHQVTREVNKALASAWGGNDWVMLFLLSKSKSD